MSILSRFFGRKERNDTEAAPLVANSAMEDPLSLIVLFPESLALNEKALVDALRITDKTLAHARVEFDPELSKAAGNVFGLAGWGRHVVKLVGFDAPMPAESLEACLAPSHYGQDLKDEVRQHKANIILYYGGYDATPLEQYIAVGLVAGALARLGAIAVINETARTSLPAGVLGDDGHGGNLAGFLREDLPLLMLFCGFVKYEVENVDGVWMRTYGANRLGLPDLAYLAAGHEQGQSTFGMFSNILAYLVESGARFSEGHTMQIGEDGFLRLRSLTTEEYFLQNEGGDLFVAEVIGKEEIGQ